MMAFHHRKFLISEPNKTPKLSKKFTEDCYLCYVCPENCYVSPPPPPPQLSSPPPQISDSSKNHIPTVLILMLCVLGVAFLVLSYLTLSRYRNSRRRNPAAMESSTANFVDENHGPILDHPIWYIRTVGLPQSAIDSIASFAYRKVDGLIVGNDCSVCLNDFQENEMLRLLPKCSHGFHLDCIDTWLRSHKNCPVCRALVLTGVNPVESSSSSSMMSNEVRNELESGGDEVEREESRDARMEKMRIVSDLADGRVRLDRDLQRVRRSVSMDFSCGSVIYDKRDEGCCSDNSKSKRNSSIHRLKRSFSFTGKKNSRSTESIQLPEYHHLQNQS